MEQMEDTKECFDFEGKTQALVFNANIEKDRHEYMFKQYAKGRVKEHSVGMRYVKLELAINSESKYDVDEKEVWDKYISDIANKEQAEQIAKLYLKSGVGLIILPESVIDDERFTIPNEMKSRTGCYYLEGE